MKKELILLVAIIFNIFLSCNAIAQNEYRVSPTDSISSSNRLKQSVNMCPGGIVFGIFSMNYEYLLGPSHGLVGRFDYEAIPKKYTEASIESSGVAFILNYRWHISGEMESIFIGAYSRYRIYNGSGILESTKFDFTLSELTMGLNAGKRWVWNSGFNVTLALGYGYSTSRREANPTNSSIESTLDKYEDQYDFLSPFLGEFSIGYAF